LKFFRIFGFFSECKRGFFVLSFAVLGIVLVATRKA